MASVEHLSGKVQCGCMKCATPQLGTTKIEDCPALREAAEGYRFEDRRTNVEISQCGSCLKTDGSPGAVLPRQAVALLLPSSF